MSFFAKKDDFSSSEEESDDDKQNQVQQNQAVQKKKYYGDDSSHSDEEETRVVKTTTDKRQEALVNVFEKMKNHIKINDFQQLQIDFDEIQAELEKCIGQIFATDKFQTLPNWVLKGLISMDDCINDVTADQKKKMNKLNAQAFTKLKQKLKKYFTETGDSENKFQAQIDKYRLNPVEDVVVAQKQKKPEKKKESESESEESSSESDESSSSSSSSSSEESEKKVTEKKKEVEKKVEKKEAKAESSSSSESESEKKSSSSSSSSSSDESDKESKSEEDSEEEVVQQGQLPKKYAFLALNREQQTPQQRRWKWVKYENLPDDMKPFFRPPSKKDEPKIDTTKTKKIIIDDEETRKTKADRIKEFNIEIFDDKDIDFTKVDEAEKILNKYKNQQISRRNYDPDQQIEVLILILKAQKDNQNLAIEILILLITTYFASAKNMVEGYFEREVWLNANQRISELISLLNQKKIDSKQKKVSTNDDEVDLETFSFTSDQQIIPALVNFIEKLDQQLFKAFQNLSAGSMAYLYRLRDECLLLKQCDNVIEFLQKHNEKEKIARIGLIKLEHIYYKNDSLYEKTKEQLKDKPEKLNDLYFLDGSSHEIVQQIVDQVIDICPSRLKLKATLLQCYHLAIHNRYYEAKDLLMKSKISQIISKQQISNQILYNRAIVTIGLSAFRLGLFDECNEILIEVSQSPKLKESLAQGISSHQKQADKSLEDELEEKKRYIPPHLHINLEFLDCVYMTTSMFLEIPNLSENKFTVQKNVINRNFRKLIEQYDLKGIQFLAQNSRDHIVFAARSLHQSNWQDAYENICNIKIFKKLEEFKNGKLKDLIEQRLKQTALRIFMIESQRSYKSYNLNSILQQFGLERQFMLKEISKLILKGTIQAKIDLKNDVVQFEDQNPQEQFEVGTLPINDSKEVEHLQNQYLGKIQQLVEANERCMELLVNQNYYITQQKSNAGGDYRDREKDYQKGYQQNKR